MSNNIKLSSLQFSCLITYSLLSSYNGICIYNLFNYVKTDSYLSIIISFFLGFIPLLIFILIFNYKKELPINKKINYLFGNILGNIINIILIILYLFIGIILIYNTCSFIIINLLPNTKIIIITLTIGIILIYNVYHGIYNISKVATIFLFIIIILYIINIFGLIPSININNLKPILENGIKIPIKGSITLTLTNTIPIFLLLIINKNNIINNKNCTKYIIIFYTISYILIFITTILTLSSLGIYLSKLYQYPEYIVLRKIKILNFIDRIENIIYLKWFLISIIYLSIIIHYISFNIKKNSHKLFPTLITTLIIIITSIIIKNNTIFNYLISHILPYTNLLILIIFIIITINIITRKYKIN